MNIPVLSTISETFTARFLFADSYTSDATDGVYFELDTNSNPNFLCKTANNNTRTSVNSGIAAVANTWYTLRVNVASTLAYFYINDVLVATITTNIPSATGRTTGLLATIVKTNGTTNSLLLMDYLYGRKLLANR